MNNFLKNFFSKKTPGIIIEICVCIMIIVCTLFVIDLALHYNTDKEIRNSRISRFMDTDEFDKEWPTSLSKDTLQGHLFAFKDYRVLPILEIETNSNHYKTRSILNFQLFHIPTNKKHNLFPENECISKSKLVQTGEYLLWVMETDEAFYLFDSRSDKAIRVTCPTGYNLLYPEEAEKSEFEEKQEEAPAEITQAAQIVINRDFLPFSQQGNQILIIAEKRDGDRLYWLYDLEEKSILPLK